MKRALRAGSVIGLAAVLFAALVPASVTAGAAVVTTNQCTLTVDPPVADPSTFPIDLQFSGIPVPSSSVNSVVLTDTSETLALDPTLIQQVVDAGFLKDGDSLPTTITLTVAASNTTEAQHTFVLHATVTLHVIGGVAQPLTQTLDLPDTTWHVRDPGLPVSFTEKREAAVVTLSISGIGIAATFTCAPSAVVPFATFGASAQVSPSSLAMGSQRVGTFGDGKTVTIKNKGTDAISVLFVGLGGTNPVDFFGDTNCTSHGRPRTLVPGASCVAHVVFSPLRLGTRRARVDIVTDAGVRSVPLSGKGTEGYYLAGAHGEVGTFGDAVFYGNATSLKLTAPMISMATTPNGGGYWLLARDGGIFSFGNAHFYGSTGGLKLNRPIVAMAASRGGRGYRLVGSDGGIFAFGDAKFYGSTGNIHLNKPIDGMAATADDRGYWLVASDGGIFAFGNAKFYGSAANAHLTSSVIQIAPTPSGKGYWILTADGHLYAYGDAHSYGTATGQHTIGMTPTPDGKGYWEATREGRIYNFGDAAAYGDLRAQGVSDVIGIASTAPPLPPELLPFSAKSLTAHAAALPGFSALPGGGRRPAATHSLATRP